MKRRLWANFCAEKRAGYEKCRICGGLRERKAKSSKLR